MSTWYDSDYFLVKGTGVGWEGTSFNIEATVHNLNMVDYTGSLNVFTITIIRKPLRIFAH